MFRTFHTFAAALAFGSLSFASQMLSGEVERTIADARVLEVVALDAAPADCVFFSGGSAAGWREGMRAEVRRGTLPVAGLTVVSVSGRVAAALIDTVAPDVRIGAGDTVTVKTQRFTN